LDATGVPAEAGGGGWRARDLLLLDEDGALNLVEVKRGSDTRIRREAVGQKLEFAANTMSYWPVNCAICHAQARCFAS
jgi:hypothetical protein